MRLRPILGLFAALSLLGASQATTAAWSFAASPDAIRAHMAYLASDELEGRDAGMPGYDLAAAYVARQFQDMGLKPGGGNGTFLQPVGLIRHRGVEAGTLRITGGAGPAELTVYEDFVPAMGAHGRDLSVSGPAAFAGYGVVAPGRDDYAGLDVRGKVVVVMDGGPSGIPADERRYVVSARAKAQMAQRHGAAGLVVINPGAVDRPAPQTPRVGGWSWTWERADGDAAYSGVPVLATLGADAAASLFEGAPQTWQEVADAAAAGQDVPRFALARGIEATLKGELGERRQSSNVVAIIEGSDPVLKNQYIVMSGHLDHTGVTTRPVNGDAINNGALDNAGGIATLIEAARGFAEGPRPRRSVIFLAVTAEEKGLIGADFFVNNPTVPREAIIANVNLDMPVMTYDFIDVAAIGAEHSTIVEAVRRAADRMSVELSPDPVPELGIFTRSDHYRFVEQGIPAVFLIGGFKNGGEQHFRDFYDNRYHRPGDDLNQALDYQAGAKWARLNYEIAWELANQDARPVFHADNLFGTRFAGPEALER